MGKNTYENWLELTGNITPISTDKNDRRIATFNTIKGGYK